MAESRRSLLLLAPGLLALPVPARGQAFAASLLISVDADCTLVVDGETVAQLSAGEAKKVPVGLGDHLVEAKDASGRTIWSSSIGVSEPKQKLVRVTPAADAAAEKAEAKEEARCAKRETCPECGGVGTSQEKSESDCSCLGGEIECSKCGGDGKLEIDWQYYRVCVTCGGSGTLRCPKCRGKGMITSYEDVRCTRCRGKGEVKPSGCS